MVDLLRPSPALFCCPHKLEEVQAPLNEVLRVQLQLESHLGQPCVEPLLNRRSDLILGCNVRRQDGSVIMTEHTDLQCINWALKHCSDIKELQVTTTSTEVISSIALFYELQRLSVMYGVKGELCPFDTPMSPLLGAHALTHLTLKCFDGVSLLVIARTCENLESLSLLGCNICKERVPSDAFPKLKSLSIGDNIPNESFFTLMRAACNLVELCLDADWIVSAFLVEQPRTPRQPHMLLQRLTLNTDLPFVQLLMSAEDLRAAIEHMPALNQLSTDSYDIRLFMQCCYPRVKLAWTTCTMCAAEFPKVDATQRKLWQEVHAGLEGSG